MNRQDIKRQSPNLHQYVPFDPADYVDNPVALARIKAGLDQEELAQRLGASQDYMNKIESQHQVGAKLLAKVEAAVKNKADK